MKLLATLLLLLLAAAVLSPARADTCPPGWTGFGTCNLPSTAGIPTLSGNGTYTGNNQASGTNSATPSSTECPAAAGTLTPAHNEISCVLNGNVTLAMPSPFTAITPYEFHIFENSTTGGFTLSIPSMGYSLPPSLLGTGPNANNILIGTTAGTENTLGCEALINPITSANEMSCTTLVVGTAPAGSAIVSSALSNNTVNVGALTATAPISYSAGDTLAIVDYACGTSCTATTQPTINGNIAGAGLGTCGLFTGAQIKNANDGSNSIGTEIDYCPVTTSETNATVTVTWSSTCYFCYFNVIDIHRSGSAADAGVGATASGSTAGMSVATNGSSPTGGIVISSFNWNDGSVIAGTGQLIIYDNNNTGHSVFGQTSAGGVVTAAPTQASAANWRGVIAGLNP